MSTNGTDNTSPLVPHIVERNGQLVLIDNTAIGVMRAVGKHNIKVTFAANADRIEHFRNRAVERGDNPKEVIIVIANCDDQFGAILADTLMPGYDWNQYREQGQIPFARGLAGKEVCCYFVREIMNEPDVAAAIEQREDLVVLVIDHQTCDFV